ncbi:MAG: hypothetical protein ACI3U1_08430 [Peptococcaceae bacterium]
MWKLTDHTVVRPTSGLAIFLFGVRYITQGAQWLIKKTDFCNGSERAKIRSLCEQTAEKRT